MRSNKRGHRPVTTATCLVTLGAAARWGGGAFVPGHIGGLQNHVGGSIASARRAPSRPYGPVTSRRAAETEAATDLVYGLSNFQGSWSSLVVAGLLYLLTLPAAFNLFKGTGDPVYCEKIYVLPGPASGSNGLSMRTIAGGISAYFQSLNYAMKKSPQEGKIRFVGNLQASTSQAIYLTLCAFGAFASFGFIATILNESGPFGLGASWWYSGTLLSPYAAIFYWDKAYREDIIELSMQESDDSTTIEVVALADKDTVDSFQRGVRFQVKGGLAMMSEKDKVYQPGIFDGAGAQANVVVPQEESEPATQTPATQTPATQTA